MAIGTIDIVTLLLATMGPMKISIVFSKYAINMTKEQQRQIAFKTTIIAASICSFFVLGGSVLLSLFHIDTMSLNIAGGIILFLYAIEMVMGKSKGDEGPVGTFSKSIAISPLAMPFFCNTSRTCRYNDTISRRRSYRWSAYDSCYRIRYLFSEPNCDAQH